MAESGFDACSVAFRNLGKKKGAQGAFCFMQEDSGAERKKARPSGGAHHVNRRVWG